MPTYPFFKPLSRQNCHKFVLIAFGPHPIEVSAHNPMKYKFELTSSPIYYDPIDITMSSYYVRKCVLFSSDVIMENRHLEVKPHCDGSFVTAIGDILKISPMTVTKESLDRGLCCHSQYWHIENWNFHEMSLMSVKKVVPTLSTFVTAISDICCYHLRLLVPVLPDLSSLTVTKESLDRGHFCHSHNWHFCPR